MASQVTPDGNVIPPLNRTAPAPAIDLKGFKWGTVDEKINGSPATTVGHDSHLQPLHAQNVAADNVSHRVVDVPKPSAPAAPPSSAPTAPPSSTASLSKEVATKIVVQDPFPLEQFTGSYAGNGFNVIFRPNSGDLKQLDAEPKTGKSDNILELNLTTEQITFGSVLDDVLNRGSGIADIHLRGLSYLQTVQDVTNPNTGRGDNPVKIGIHFEPSV